MTHHDLDKLVGHLFRTESGKMVAVLTRLLGFENIQTAEDIVQESLLKAMSVWKFNGIPDNPQAWLYTVARRKAIDALREKQLHNSIHSEILQSASSEWTLAPTVHHYFLPDEIEDSQLRMIFASCHPAIPYDSQVAFALKTLCGLSVAEISRSFLTNEDTISKRLFRAREKIREENIRMEVPPPQELGRRQEAVLQTLYLLFNEGNNASQANDVIREDLCIEAIRLTLLLVNNPKTRNSATLSLLALMCLQAARQDARIDGTGDLVLLKDQDRSKWNHALIQEGLRYLDLAADAELTNAYQVEAAIAACHASAPTFEQTDWKQIVILYEALEQFKPGPITALNKAIATGFAFSPHQAIEALLGIEGLDRHHHYFAALADFYSQLGDRTSAKEYYAKSLQQMASPAEHRLVQKKISALS